MECKCGETMNLKTVNLIAWGDTWNASDTDTNFFLEFARVWECPYCNNIIEENCYAHEDRDPW